MVSEMATGMALDKFWQQVILRAMGARALFEGETIQELWSGYGTIRRINLEGGDRSSVVVKHIAFPDQRNHPRGWNNDLSHKRKVKSYRVEAAWYRDWSSLGGEQCRLPACFAQETRGDETLLVLEDLDAVGFDRRRSRVSWVETAACLAWLAHFHARFLGRAPEGLWKNGTYWHLDTRPDELKALDAEDPVLKKAAGSIDSLLKQARFRTIVHGDAKLANFCFTRSGQRVAAVDFQYVGGGCGMQDVAYFVGSCFSDRECEEHEEEILSHYFACLKTALPGFERFSELEAEWRRLYPVAWTDFHRFLKGWSPGHWKINAYSERLAREVIAGI